VLRIKLSHNGKENEKHQEQARKPVAPKKLFVVKQARKPVAKKKLVENAAKYQIKHSYSLFPLPDDK
jgi:hypothetical protein